MRKWKVWHCEVIYQPLTRWRSSQMCTAKTSSKYDFSRPQTQGETKADKARRTRHDQSNKLYGKYVSPFMLEGLLQSVPQTLDSVHFTRFNSIVKCKDDGQKVQRHRVRVCAVTERLLSPQPPQLLHRDGNFIYHRGIFMIKTINSGLKHLTQR